jgi:hypothetical protein
MLQSAGGPPPEGLSASDRAAWLDVSGRLERAATAGTHAPAVDLQRVSVHDLALKGIVRTPQGYTALLLDPKGRTYFVSEGQKFLDGEMGKIEDGSINLRSAKDPKSPKRDVKVLLRPVKGRPDD